jgi:hypothetical protein
VNGRIKHDETPEGRIAALARSLCLQMAEEQKATGRGPTEPDYADFRDVLRPFIQLELLRARIDEARKTSAHSLTARMRELDEQVLALKFPKGYDL